MNPAAQFRDMVRLLLGHAGRYRVRTLQDIATRALREPGGGRAWVVSALNLTLALRQRGRYWMRLEPRRWWSRRAFARSERRVYAGPRRSIALLCPTRDRVGQVARLARSAARTAAAPERVELLCYVDSDDPALPRYEALFARGGIGGLGRSTLLVGEPVGVPTAWNRLATDATADLLLMANDDQLYIDHGWDVALDMRVSALSDACPDGLLCLYFDAGQYPEGGRDFPIVTRQWYTALGYFVPTMFSQWEVETWVFDIAERLGRLHPVPDVFVEHLHYQDYKAPFDATYQRHRMTREKSLADHALFLRTAYRREAEAARLQAMIDRFWFAGHLAEHQARMAGEVAAARAATSPIVLFGDGAWTTAASTSFPVTTDVMLAVPEATLPPAGTVELVPLAPGRATPAPGGTDDGLLWVYCALSTSDEATVVVDGHRRTWRSGECLVFRAGQPPIVRNEGAAPLVVLRFTVPDPCAAPAGSAVSGRG